MTSSDGTVNISPECGAWRVWFKSDWSSTLTGLGSGSGDVARLLTLISMDTNGNASTIYSLLVSADGNALQLVCGNGSNEASACLSAPIAWVAGTWNLLTVCYSPTNSALFINDALVASGDGLPTIPADAVPNTGLVIGSDLNGQQIAFGQLEFFTAFNGSRRIHHSPVCDFGLDPFWNIMSYYQYLSPFTAMGCLSPAEIAARDARQARLNAQQVSNGLLSPSMSSPMFDEGGSAGCSWANLQLNMVGVTNGLLTVAVGTQPGFFMSCAARVPFPIPALGARSNIWWEPAMRTGRWRASLA
jgi:hypothetical protein